MSTIWNEINSLVINRSHSYLFTCLISQQLYDYLHDDFNFETTLRYLSLKLQLTIRRIRNDKVRIKRLVNMLFTRFVLNMVISKLEEMKGNVVDFHPFRELTFEYNEYGKPFVKQQKIFQFWFNSSSSNDLLSLIIEFDMPVGIDLSHAQQAVSQTRFLEEFSAMFDESEIHQLLSIPREHNYRYYIFNQFWTLKEAFTKLVGCGLNINLAKFHFDLHRSYVVDDADIDFDHPELIKPFTINWKQGIDIDISQFNHPLLEKLPCLEFYCKSATLINSNQNFQTLPVLISVINQRQSRCLNYDIGFLKVLETII